MDLTVICRNDEDRVTAACPPASSLVTLLHNGNRDRRLIVAFGARISILAGAVLVCAIVLQFAVMKGVTVERLDLIRPS
jgi:hypothetical protein